MSELIGNQSRAVVVESLLGIDFDERKRSCAGRNASDFSSIWYNSVMVTVN